ncbi:putative RNA-directed DNA polymerase from transposon BS [Merluccius polli]|uniref:RNA-directed DNA polymerase from transposon BS n=1 Tax=Merluccius polli TaxID=89951 RepID=A0AA47M4E4_MERPO|nr:putative RNA-directed DNA polymerase from transposon BS [Merluccius polli]
MTHIKSILPPTLDPFQFAYRTKHSTEDAICSALHPALTHLEKAYVRMLFIDFSSAFNTIIPEQLICKLDQLGLNTSLCNWILDFLSERPQAVRVGNNTSSSITLSTGAPQGCVLSPLLFTLLTHYCTPTHSTHSTNHMVKFADDTTLMGLITKNETHYRKEVKLLTTWCSDNNLLLNVSKTMEIVIDFRKGHTEHSPLTIEGAAVDRVSSTKFLGVHISEDLSWTTNSASLAKKAQRRLYFLRKLKRAKAPTPILNSFYRGTIESILTSCITVWGGSCTAYSRKALQRIVNTAGKIIGAPLPSLQDTYTTRLTRKATSIVSDTSHPAHTLLDKFGYREERLLKAESLSTAAALDLPAPVLVGVQLQTPRHLNTQLTVRDHQRNPPQTLLRQKLLQSLLGLRHPLPRVRETFLSRSSVPTLKPTVGDVSISYTGHRSEGKGRVVIAHNTLAFC